MSWKLAQLNRQKCRKANSELVGCNILKVMIISATESAKMPQS
jgi:hypothetical protein